ncbi:MAG TPA: CAP domain-containing protein [Dehalococcoidia bacterium]|nr:CAP domain-containing protein [Dehalococcoidia bacterium]
MNLLKRSILVVTILATLATAVVGTGFLGGGTEKAEAACTWRFVSGRFVRVCTTSPTPTPTPTNPTPTPTPTPAPSGSTVWTSTELALLQKHNTTRAAQGLRTLSRTENLGKAADRRCQEIIKSFSHTGWTSALAAYGVTYRIAGENIAAGQTSVDSVFNAWMNSTGHRANILRSSFSQAGVGHCKSSTGRNYWVVNFIGT